MMTNTEKNWRFIFLVYSILKASAVEVMIPISTPDIGNEDAFHTANILDYIIDLEPFGVKAKDVKSIRFDVKACENTFLILSGSNDQTQPMYEVIISGYDNSYAIIRRRNDDSLTSNSQHWIGVVELLDDQRQSCSSYKSYWLSWETGHLKLGGGAILNSDVIVDGTDTNPLRVNKIFIFSGWGDTAEWTIYVNLDNRFSGFYSGCGLQDVRANIDVLYSNSWSKANCAVACGRIDICLGFNYDSTTTSTNRCEILGATSPVIIDFPQTHQVNWIFYSKCYDDKGMCIGCFF
ncbi:Hypothetical predicted protein [Mytilus galloprovincialis]|uniref:Farnesoic acid O-methyl transferase domain-containing protein n=1 Tax=Mytilus galloprovincialis TaxID=29158 RepID=A0A8B6FPI4_MYTGA|nr:Hypothetical predicted protein [Mytilus galloprovincialis]VDI53128.1 Hypothetical predicted protein [Mytilus galloprovincialis]